jgi:molybdenum storage protein
VPEALSSISTSFAPNRLCCSRTALAAKSSAQNAYVVACLLADSGFVYLEAPFIVQVLPAMLAAARGAVFNGIPPYDLWEHPPAVGKIPTHGSDTGSYLVGEVFGARSVIQ